MISVFNFKDYRAYIRARFDEMPKRGYGQSLKMAEALGVHTTLVSLVLKGTKSFTTEQAAQACEFLELSNLETDYFLVLVQLDRCGKPSLKKHLTRQLQEIRDRASQVSARRTSQSRLSAEHAAVFYSDWIYSGVRQMTAIPGFQTEEAIASRFGLTHRRMREIMEFLLATGLCLEENGRLKVGPSSTQLNAGSTTSRWHHVNWRQKCIESLSREGHAKIHSTTPMTLSAADCEVIYEMIIKFTETVDKIVDPSPSEKLRCLNIDWFEV